MRMLFWVAFVTFLVDQATKYLVVHILDLQRVLAIDVIPPFFNLRMAWNTGVNFGLFSQDSDTMRWILILVAFGISLAVLWWVRREQAGRWQLIGAGLLIGGALGNIIDRLLYGAVADFINMSCCGFNNPYAFNVADIAVFAGALALIVFTPGKKAA